MKICRSCGRADPPRGFVASRGVTARQEPRCRECRDSERRARSAAQYETDRHIHWEGAYRRRCLEYGVDPVVRSFTREDMLAHWNNGERCIYCDGPYREIDHLIPVGLGGIHAVENVAPSCVPCNRQNVNTIRRACRLPATA